MLRQFCIGVAVIALGCCNVAGASDPAVAGDLTGVELAAQSDFNPAIFVGLFSGSVDGTFAFGFWSAGVNHQTPLPGPLDGPIDITGGQWSMQLWKLQGFRLRRVSLAGEIEGQLAFFDTDLFLVNATMNVTRGGSGDILLTLLLDHTVFPPGVSGVLSQP